MNLFIKSRNGIDIINLANVAYLKADGNYSAFYFLDGNVQPQLTLSFNTDKMRPISTSKGNLKGLRDHIVKTYDI